VDESYQGGRIALGGKGVKAGLEELEVRAQSLPDVGEPLGDGLYDGCDP